MWSGATRGLRAATSATTNSRPDELADGRQNKAANVVIQTVQVTYGPWYENSEGGLEVQANLVGSGAADVFRNGVEVIGTWERASSDAPTRLLDDNGSVISLRPGNTWIELVPSTVSVNTDGTASGAP